ncbi:MAG TPA: M23 family metallopeptidase [Holophaga sp.]|nr:M23 family metallopeptidase [Holophaga sp.]
MRPFLPVAAALLAALALALPGRARALGPAFPQLLRRPSPRLPVPVEGVRAAWIGPGFGSPRSGGRRHQGLDIFAPRGAAVRSATEGAVARVGWDRLGGRVVTVLGPGGEWHYYAHLETWGPVREGQRVKAGQLLGTVGDSGNARGTPPHLHYGIYGFWGRARDPFGRIRGRPAAS